MRRKNTGPAMNLDSLLDTITNVVGFLVVVLIIVQLNVADTTARLARPGGAGGEGTEELAKEIDELEARLAELSHQISQKKTEINERPSISSLRDEKKSLDARMRELLEEIARIKQRIADARGDLAGLGSKIAKTEGQIAGRKKTGTSVEEIPNLRIVSYASTSKTAVQPDWAKKKRVTFICRGGRVFPLNAARLDGLTLQAVRRCLGISAPRKVEITSVAELRKIAKYFDDRVIGDEYVRIKMEVYAGTRLRITYKFRSDVQGETTDVAKGRSSEYVKFFSRSDNIPSKVWVRFLVWSDSFETYRDVRAIASARGYQVGWLPYGKDQELTASGGGGTATRRSGPGL